MNKDQLSQLIQDVIDGEESAIKANNILIEMNEFIVKCLNEIDDFVILERRNKLRNGSTKD